MALNACELMIMTLMQLPTGLIASNSNPAIIKSIKETVDPLLGKKPDPEFVNRIRDIVMSYDEIIGIHDLVVHDYGPGRCMISLHGEVSEEGNLIELHDAIDRCERELHDTLGCEAVIHMDPISVNDERVISMRNAVTQMIHKYDDKITIHDFRVVDGKTHTNVIFDAVIPAGSDKSPQEVKEAMQRIVAGLPGNCIGVIDIDMEYAEWNG